MTLVITEGREFYSKVTKLETIYLTMKSVVIGT